jgi:hypothetical protein
MLNIAKALIKAVKYTQNNKIKTQPNRYITNPYTEGQLRVRKVAYTTSACSPRSFMGGSVREGKYVSLLLSIFACSLTDH